MKLNYIKLKKKEYGRALLKDILSQIKPEIYNKLAEYLHLSKILKEIIKHIFGTGSFSKIK